MRITNTTAIIVPETTLLTIAPRQCDLCILDWYRHLQYFHDIIFYSSHHHSVTKVFLWLFMILKRILSKPPILFWDKNSTLLFDDVIVEFLNKFLKLLTKQKSLYRLKPLIVLKMSWLDNGSNVENFSPQHHAKFKHRRFPCSE